MWLLKCPQRRDLITDTMHPLCRQCDRNLYLSTLWALWTRWAQKSICIPECGFFKPHSLDGIWEIVHIFVRETVAPRWRACFRTWPTCLHHASFSIDHKPNCWGNAQERPCWDFYCTSNLLTFSARFSRSLTNMLNSLASHKTFTGLTSSVSRCVICVCACVCMGDCTCFEYAKKKVDIFES